MTVAGRTVDKEGDRVEFTRQQIIDGLISEYALFADLVAPLSPSEWDAPTRCANWAVRDVAGHVAGNALDTVRGIIGSRGPDEQASAYRDDSPTDLAAALQNAAVRMRRIFEAVDDEAWLRPSPVASRTIGNGALTLWYDAFVHADDIRAALGRPPQRGAGLPVAVQWLVTELGRRGWGPARLSLDGLPETAIGDGNGPVLQGDPIRFVLVASGRRDPAEFGLDESVNVHG